MLLFDFTRDKLLTISMHGRGGFPRSGMPVEEAAREKAARSIFGKNSYLPMAIASCSTCPSIFIILYYF